MVHMKITEMLVNNKTVRPYRALKEIRGLVVHYVGCSCRSARQLRNALQNSTREASYQYCIDYDSGEIIRCLPEEEEAWHVGASESLYTAQKRKICGSENPNRYLVGIECCVPSIQDCEPSAVQRKALAEFCADFLKRRGMSTDKLYLHHDIVEKNCHKWFVEHPDDWLKFKGEVLALMGSSSSQETSPTPSSNIYRVRKSWADEASQKGAFSSLENALELAKSTGLKVYDGSGKQVYPAGETAAPSPAPAPAVYYWVRTEAHGWLPEVKGLADYAGYKDSPITDIAIRVTEGTVKYRVHVLGGGWLPYVTGCNIQDSRNGYAGSGKAIDAVEVYYSTPKGQTVRRAKYRVAPTGGNYYPWQYDNETTGGQDGYAGSYGRKIGKLQITLE